MLTQNVCILQSPMMQLHTPHLRFVVLILYSLLVRYLCTQKNSGPVGNASPVHKAGNVANMQAGEFKAYLSLNTTKTNMSKPLQRHLLI